MAAETSDIRTAWGNIIPVEATHGPPTNSEGTGVSRKEGQHALLLSLHTLKETYTLQHSLKHTVESFYCCHTFKGNATTCLKRQARGPTGDKVHRLHCYTCTHARNTHIQHTHTHHILNAQVRYSGSSVSSPATGSGCWKIPKNTCGTSTCSHSLQR